MYVILVIIWSWNCNYPLRNVFALNYFYMSVIGWLVKT